ncbi:hypothetical protein P9112_006426 [Eukaryota sp. TZLM1-RC]
MCVIKSIDGVENTCVLVPLIKFAESAEVILLNDQDYTASIHEIRKLLPKKGDEIIIVEFREDPELIGSMGILKTKYGEDAVVMLGDPSDLKIVNIGDIAGILKPFVQCGQ